MALIDLPTSAGTAAPAHDTAPPIDGRAHPRGAPGAYRIPDAMSRFVKTRSPLCEWPGCGHRAVTCDVDHDLAWPAGPTCGCNLGPACRRHHRIKQTGWTKTRCGTGVTWTSPTGRDHDSPGPWSPPSQGRRPMAPASPELFFSPAELEDMRWDGEPPLDPDAYELRVSDSSSAGLAGGAAPR